MHFCKMHKYFPTHKKHFEQKNICQLWLRRPLLALVVWTKNKNLWHLIYKKLRAAFFFVFDFLRRASLKGLRPFKLASLVDDHGLA